MYSCDLPVDGAVGIQPRAQLRKKMLPTSTAFRQRGRALPREKKKTKRKSCQPIGQKGWMRPEARLTTREMNIPLSPLLTLQSWIRCCP